MSGLPGESVDFCLFDERKAIRHAMIVENLQQLYTDIYNDWIVANEQMAEELRWRAAAIDRYLKLRLKGSQLNFVQAQKKRDAVTG